MKNAVIDVLKIVMLIVILTTTANAGHDQGQGKSQHPDKYDSVSVAPEPSAFWLFLTGALMLTVVGQHRKKRSGTQVS